MKTETLTEKEEETRGEYLAQVLGLKKRQGNDCATPRYQTEWGSKTAIGLFRTVARIIEEGQPSGLGTTEARQRNLLRSAIPN